MVRELKAGGGSWDGEYFEGLGSVVWVLWVVFFCSSFILSIILSCGTCATKGSATETDKHGAACGAGCGTGCGG